jgi:hypothetical protein
LTSGVLDAILWGMSNHDEREQLAPEQERLERELTLRSAVARYEELWARHALADDAGHDETAEPGSSLTKAEALELLALGEVIARKARYGRQLAVRTARAAGASWSQIGRALGTSKQTAWETHTRWIDQQADLQRHRDFEGFDQAEAARARALAGEPDGEPGQEAQG